MTPTRSSRSSSARRLPPAVGRQRPPRARHPRVTAVLVARRGLLGAIAVVAHHQAPQVDHNKLGYDHPLLHHVDARDTVIKELHVVGCEIAYWMPVRHRRAAAARGLPLCTVGQPSLHGIRTILIGGHAYNGNALKPVKTRFAVRAEPDRRGRGDSVADVFGALHAVPLRPKTSAASTS